MGVVLAALLAVAAGAGDPEGNYIVPGTRGGIVYRRVGGQELKLDAYAQRRGARRPGVVVIHGGGWTSGSRVAFVGQLLETLTRAGYNWLSIDYRLGGSDRRAEALDDVRAALAFLRENARDLRIDPERLALLGEDAGASLAASLAAEKPAGVRAVALVGGLYDGGEASRAGDAAREPDTLVVHGERDTEVPPEQARRFCEGLAARGARCELQMVSGAIHRGENWLPAQWGYKETLVKFLAARLGPDRPDHEPYRTQLEKDVVYDLQRGLRLDAWTPAGPGPFAAVVLAHGGGWEAGDNNARRFRIDPRRIAVVGESASGQMADLLATQDKDLAAVVSFYGVYDFMPLVTDTSPGSRLDKLFGLRALDDGARELIRRYSPIHHVARDMPPLLLIHGTNEMLWAQGTAMRDRLREVGARHELLALEGAPHGMENWEGHPEWAHYKTRLVEWLSEQLGAKP